MLHLYLQPQVIARGVGQILAHTQMPFCRGDGGVAQGEVGFAEGPRVPLVRRFGECAADAQNGKRTVTTAPWL
jgi:hypothetical protein